MNIQTFFTRRLSFFEHFDPGGILFKLTMRTLFAAFLSLIVFTFFHRPYVGIWVAFSAQFVMQTDPGIFFDSHKRLLFLFIVTSVFSLLVFFGSLLAEQMMGFSLALAVLAFLTGYASSFGKIIYNASIWALICFLLMTALPEKQFESWRLMVFFFSGGIIALLVLRISFFFRQRGLLNALFSKTFYQSSCWIKALVNEDVSREQEYRQQVKKSLRLQQTQVIFSGTRKHFFKAHSVQSVIDLNKAIQRLYPFLIIIGKMKHSTFGRSFLFSDDLDALLKRISLNLIVLSERITGNTRQAWVQFEPEKLQKKMENAREKFLRLSEKPSYDEMFLVSDFFFLYKTFDRRLSEINALILDLEME